MKNFQSWNLAPYPTNNTEINLDEKIRRFVKASPEENGTGQYSVWMTQKPRKGDFRGLKSKIFHGGAYPRTPLRACYVTRKKE